MEPDGGWSVKTGTQGHKESVFGYKLHLLVDCEYELPIAANVSAGNVNDIKRASNVLREARATGPFFPQFVLADAGYSSIAPPPTHQAAVLGNAGHRPEPQAQAASHAGRRLLRLAGV